MRSHCETELKLIRPQSAVRTLLRNSFEIELQSNCCENGRWEIVEKLAQNSITEKPLLRPSEKLYVKRLLHSCWKQLIELLRKLTSSKLFQISSNLWVKYCVCLYFRVERKERARLKNVKFTGKGQDRVSTLDSIDLRMVIMTAASSFTTTIFFR